MLYYADSNKSSNCRFIFDSSDNSVELCSIKDLKKYDIKVKSSYTGKEPDYRKGSANWARIKLLGAIDEDDFLHKILCSYRINDIQVELILYINGGNGRGLLELYRLEGYFHGGRIGASWFGADDVHIFIYIPSLMIPYVLHLYGVKDFDSIMRCVNNYFGGRISYLVYGFNNKVEVEFLEWY